MHRIRKRNKAKGKNKDFLENATETGADREKNRKSDRQRINGKR